MSEKKTQWQAIENTLEKLARKNPLIRRGQVLGRLETFWPEIAGAGLAQQCYPEKLQYKILWLKTKNPAWAQQLHFYQRELIGKINIFFSKVIVEKIRCESDSWQPQKKAKIVKLNPPGSISEQELLSVEQELAEEIKSPGLKRRMAILWSKARKVLRARAKEARLCKKCGQTYRGTNPQICLFCEEKARQEKRQKVARLLRETPWAGFSSLQKELKTIGEEAFFEIKEDVRRQKHDRMRQAVFSFLKDPRPQDRDRVLRGISEYVSLRSGLTPEKINDKIVQKIIGVRKTRLLKLKGVKI